MLPLKTTCVASLISLFFVANAQNPLRDYYSGKKDLEEEQILDAIEYTLQNHQEEHLIAYAYYLKAVRFRRANKNFESYETYDKALEHLLKADTTDTYLQSAILRNQGVILKQHWLMAQAIEKYQRAIEPAYDYSLERGLSVKYNLGRALALHDQESALEVFLESLEEAEKAGLRDRQAKITGEIGLMFIRSEDYDHALDYLQKAVSLADRPKEKSVAYHYLSNAYYYLGQYQRQEQLLKLSIQLVNGKDKFNGLRDLGECYLKQGRYEDAQKVLKQAENYYTDTPLNEENIVLFDWLANATGDSTRYLEKALTETRKLVQVKNQLEILLKKQAMESLLARLQAKKQDKRKIIFYRVIAVLAVFSVVLILFTWRVWWYRLRKNLAKKILAIIDRWEEEDAIRHESNS